MTSDEIKLSAMLAEKTLANLGLTPAAVRKPESWQFMTAGRTNIQGTLIGNARNVKRREIRHQAQAHAHASSAHVAASNELRRRLIAVKKQDFGSIVKVWKKAGFAYDVVTKLMTGEQATMRPDRIAKITSALDALYPQMSQNNG